VRSFTEPDLFDDNVLFGNTTLIYLINLPWKLGLGLRLDLKSCTILAFFTENKEIKKTSISSFTNFTEGNIVLKEHTHSINNQMKLYILGVPMNKLGN